MGMTIWVLQKTRVAEGDDCDHSLFFDAAESLDAIAGALGVRKPSEFFDEADLRFNMSEEELPESWIAENAKWYSPDDAVPTFTALIDHLHAGDPGDIPADQRSGLAEELDDCLKKINRAKAEGDLFQLCIVM